MKFNPDGQCIYCSNPSDSDEHVIPLGLNGTYVLKSASCATCSTMTSQFELSLLRGAFAQLRVGHDFKTRRKKKRPKSFPLLVTNQGRDRLVDAKPQEHPLVLNLPFFPFPKIFSANAPDPRLIPSGGAVLHLNAIEDVLSAHGADRVATEERFQHVELARLLAKAAYGFLIGELGRARVKGSYLLPIIFGDVSAAGLYIGSSDKVLNFKPSDPAFKFTSYRFPLDRGGHEIAVAIIRLLPHLATGPAYVVVCDLNEVNSA